jgi:hypothetical protein
MRHVVCGTIGAGLVLFLAAQGRCQEARPSTAAQPAGTVQVPAKPVPRVPEPAYGDSLYAPIAVGSGPETLAVKTQLYIVTSFGPRAFFTPLISAGKTMVHSPHGYPDDWTVGPTAFARNYGAAFGGRVASNSGRYVVGVLLHEDFRYVPSSDTRAARLGHAIGYALVDRGDSGGRRLAAANLAGAAAGGFVPNLYLPDGFNTNRDGLVRFGYHMGGIAGQNVLREFSPEIFHFVQKLHIPFPRIPVGEWWTKDWPPAQP